MQMSKPSSVLRENGWILIVLAVFGIAYACSLTFVYIDPGDAMSLEYHALGRNDAIQPPFERFQMGMDKLLSLLPHDEPLVRATAMTVTALAEVGLVLLVLLLAFDFMDTLTAVHKAGIALALLLAAPELIYLGLLYTPMLVGMCCAVGAHLLLRHALRNSVRMAGQVSWKNLGLIGSGVLMGVAGIFRWDILAYGIVVALDILLDPQDVFGQRSKSFFSRLRVPLIWGTIALFIWLGIEVFALGLAKALPEMVESAKETRGETNVRDIRMFVSHAMFFSPAFLLAAVVGWIVIIRKQTPMRWFVIIMTLFAAVWPFWSTPKEVLVFVPFFVILFCQGAFCVWQCGVKRTWSAIWRISFVVLLLLPWLIGLQISFGDKSWGPGFELRPFSHPVGSGIHDVRLVLGAGAAFPSNEGVRPLFGHASVLLGGKWREFAEKNSREIDQDVQIAYERSLAILTFDGYDSYLMNSAVRAGFTTKDSKRRPEEKDPYVRRLVDKMGKKLILVGLTVDTSELDSTGILWAIQKGGAEKMVCWSEPSQMRGLYRLAPSALEELGPRSAIIDLRVLLAAVHEGKHSEKPL